MINQNKNQAIHTLLGLLRLGLNHEQTPLPKYINWNVIYKLAQQQGLSAIILDGIEKMYCDNLNPECPDLHPDFKLDWITYVYNCYEKYYLKYTQILGSLAEFYNTHGYKLMILKGYGLSLNYPYPDRRPCGDIDTWAFGDYKLVDASINKEFGIFVDRTHHHHTVYEWCGSVVENHYDFVNVHYGHKNAELERVFKRLAMDDSFSTLINNNIVYLPSPNLNVLFLLRHTMLHFASTSMNLRQLLDWGFFIKRYSKEIDWDSTLTILKTFNMVDFFDYMNAICVFDLGFDADDYPYINYNLKLRQRILADTIFPEFNKVCPNGTIKNAIFRWQRRKANKWKRELCYKDEGFSSLLHSIWTHIIKP